MPSIEDRIRELATQRRIVAINLWPALSGKWQANISADRVSWTVGLDDDPIVALEKAVASFVGKVVHADLEDMLG